LSIIDITLSTAMELNLTIETEDVFGIGSGDWSSFTKDFQCNGNMVLNLNLNFDDGVQVNENLSPTGTLNLDGVRIKAGIQNSPHQYFVESVDDLNIVSTLGKGNGGVVKKCVHKESQRVMAVKCVSLLNTDRLNQFSKEINTLMDVGNHQNIVKLYGATLNIADSHVLLALEYMDFGSFEDILEERGPMPELLCADVAKSMLQGLGYLHDLKVLHRDIKPGNVLINSRFEIKLADFGITKTMENTVDFTKTQVGTTSYMAPERVEGLEYSFKSDVWSLGMTIYFLAMNEHFFDPNQPTLALMADIHSRKKPEMPMTFCRYFRSFICATTDGCPHNRYGTSRLLTHPFVTLDVSKEMWAQYLN